MTMVAIDEHGTHFRIGNESGWRSAMICRGLALRASILAASLLAGPAAIACSVSATGVAFGSYDPQQLTPTDGVGTVQLDCHRNSSPVISVSAGGSGSFLARRMSNGSSTLLYNLYTGPAMIIILGDGTGGSATMVPVAGSPSGSRRLHVGTIHGRIPALQNVTAGTYGDSLVITVSF
jgi:spore coat protein U-like protein